MRIPKKYGQSKITNCPFCNKTSIATNKQGIPVCKLHTSTNLPDLKCVCGEYLDLKQGKYGPYFNCMSCGNINFNKAMEMNPDAISQSEKQMDNKTRSEEKTETEQKKPSKPTEKTITSEEMDIYFT